MEAFKEQGNLAALAGGVGLPIVFGEPLLLEDTFGLINDEMFARKPEEEILADIEDVISQTDSMARVLTEMSANEQIVQALDQIRVK